MDHFKHVLGYWLPLAIVASGLCLFTYVGIQQNYRMNANDPQIEMAENAAGQLSSGASMDQVVSSVNLKIESSLSPFMILFDANGKALTNSVTLDGQIPALPTGVLTAARSNGENRVTWQPRSGVRIAAVIVPYTTEGKTSYVLAGRSLKEAEARIDNLTLMFVLTWLCAMVLSLVAVFFAEYVLLHPKNHN
jgi:hypothetical protein